ncbi:MAG: restriction endonuclease subunit S, partial [Nanoarchaeota archaeon]
RIRYIRITDIDEKGNLRDEKVSPSRIEEKYLLKKGDLLFARSGATVGKTYLHNSNDLNYQYAGYLIRFKFKDNITPEYVYYFTKTPKYLGWIASIQKVVAQPNINAQQYSSLQIPLPPIELQQKFSSIVEHVEKMKEKQKESGEQIKNLFNALVQKAFKGELIK